MKHLLIVLLVALSLQSFAQKTLVKKPAITHADWKFSAPIEITPLSYCDNYGCQYVAFMYKDSIQVFDSLKTIKVLRSCFDMNMKALGRGDLAYKILSYVSVNGTVSDKNRKAFNKAVKAYQNYK